jgi:hypothetical protein
VFVAMSVTRTLFALTAVSPKVIDVGRSVRACGVIVGVGLGVGVGVAVADGVEVSVVVDVALGVAVAVAA